MRILFCGDREWSNYKTICDVMADLKPDVVIEGEARGADSMARDAAEYFGIPVERYPANWKVYGRAAGPIRNTQMLDEGKPDLVVAFHNDFKNSKGTKNMVEQARKRGIPTKIYTAEAIWSFSDTGMDVDLL
jgi:hypothetical protein